MSGSGVLADHTLRLALAYPVSRNWMDIGGEKLHTNTQSKRSGSGCC